MTLTLDAWGEVLSHLGVRAYDPGGLVGACLAARWLGTAAAVCRDLRVAARGAMADLGAAVSDADTDTGELQELGIGDRPVPEHVTPRLVLRAYLERTRWTRKRFALMGPFDAEILEALMGLKFAGHPGASPTRAHDIYNLPCLVDLQAALCRAFPVGGEGTHRRALVGAWQEHEAEKVRVADWWFARREETLQESNKVRFL
jgi:hypothetical protein